MEYFRRISAPVVAISGGTRHAANMLAKSAGLLDTEGYHVVPAKGLRGRKMFQQSLAKHMRSYPTLVLFQLEGSLSFRPLSVILSSDSKGRLNSWNYT